MRRYHIFKAWAYCPTKDICETNRLHLFVDVITFGGLPLAELRRFHLLARCTVCGELNPLTRLKTD